MPKHIHFKMQIFLTHIRGQTAELAPNSTQLFVTWKLKCPVKEFRRMQVVVKTLIHLRKEKCNFDFCLSEFDSF